MWPVRRKKRPRLGELPPDQQDRLNRLLSDEVLPKADDLQEQAELAAQAVERAWQQAPNEIAWPLMLCWYCLLLERYEAALRAAERSAAAAPSDPRPVYALATVYHTLGRVREGELSPYEHHVLREAGQQWRAAMPGVPGPIAPGTATEAMIQAADKLGLSLYQIRSRAVWYFEQTLNLGVHAADRRQVEQDLAAARTGLARTPKEDEP